MQSTETNLINAIKYGDSKVFEHIFKIYFNSLFLYARGILGSSEIARDIIQEVFLNLWEKKDSINITSSLKSFLYSTVYNACIDYIRRKQTEQKYADTYKMQLAAIEHTYYDKVVEKEQLLINQAIQNQINKAIENLPEQCRIIFKMSRFENFKNYEIAEKLNLSIRTVDTQIYRALKSLREQLKDTYSFYKSLHSFLLIIQQINIFK